MISQGHSLITGVSQRADTQPVFKTWSSIDQELAVHRAPPRPWTPRALHVSARKNDRASILDRIIAFCVAIVFGIIGAGSLIIGSLYWFF